MKGQNIILVLLACFLALGLVFVSCDDDSISSSLHIPVVTITEIPTTGTVGATTLSGTVTPPNATNRTIIWAVASAGDTGATISGSTLTTTTVGTVIVRATIRNGVASGMDFTQNATITISTPGDFVAVTGITITTTTGTVGATTLTGTVAPPNATNRTIIWTVATPSDSPWASIAPGTDVLNTTAAGTVTVRATITNGATTNTDFWVISNPITINPAGVAFIPVTGITGVPTTASDGVPLTLTGTIVPPNANAVNETIVWTVTATTPSDTTWASIAPGANVLETDASGEVAVLATIANGLATGTNFTRTFYIDVE